jgi:ectoine hydroxylase-related dioxygenase (phytanoyl-CoA dioxygenase family)
VQDFTRENGATHFVPGSNHWPRGRRAERQDLALQAAMPAGSVLLWTGATLHGAGCNRSPAPRHGLLTGYQVMASSSHLIISSHHLISSS